MVVRQRILTAMKMTVMMRLFTLLTLGLRVTLLMMRCTELCTFCVTETTAT